MFVTFYSNFLNDHQIPFCNAMYKYLNGNFRFVATEPMDDERIKMKFEDVTDKYPFAINSYLSDEQYNEAMKLATESDVVIIGSAPDEFIEKRLEQNKLTFRYTERYFKQGRWRILDPRVIRAHYLTDMRYKDKPLYVMCASAYTAPDCRFIGCYKNKTFKWGYFPQVKHYDEDKLMENKHSGKTSILWVGRQIGWKHPEKAISVAKALKENGHSFHMTIIGDGDMRKGLEKSAEQYGLTDEVSFLDFLPQSLIRQHMEKANIFLFTSDRQEGWGAVLNESMNSGCAVVANDEIGSVPFLIESGVNGLSYHKTTADLIDKVESLMTDKEKQNKMGLNAYHTMRDVWNADVAADRFLHLVECIREGKEVEYSMGPCSRC